LPTKRTQSRDPLRKTIAFTWWFGGKAECVRSIGRMCGGIPDFFMFGDPRNNYYRGSVYYDDIKLEAWQEY
jgi:hypothetical protein